MFSSPPPPGLLHARRDRVEARGSRSPSPWRRVAWAVPVLSGGRGAGQARPRRARAGAAEGSGSAPSATGLERRRGRGAGPRPARSGRECRGRVGSGGGAKRSGRPHRRTRLPRAGRSADRRSASANVRPRAKRQTDATTSRRPFPPVHHRALARRGGAIATVRREAALISHHCIPCRNSGPVGAQEGRGPPSSRLAAAICWSRAPSGPCRAARRDETLPRRDRIATGS